MIFRYYRISAFVLIFLFLIGCAHMKDEDSAEVLSKKLNFKVVVYPVENLSGTIVPIQEIRQSFVEGLRQKGFDIVEEETIQKFMARNRIRYTGGLDIATAKAFNEQAKVDGILIISVELYSDTVPPKIALISRLVSTGDNATISWIDGVGMAGDDNPGILALGLIEDPKVLTKKAVKSLVDSLARYMANDGEKVAKIPKRYQPRIAFRSPLLGADRKYTVAVVPFLNRSERKYAGEILVLHFIRQLKHFEQFEVIEPGIIRQELLSLRIIMEEGISLDQADAVLSVLNAELVLSGKVIDYQDYRGGWGKPIVEFSAALIERKGQRVIWSSTSYNEGDEGVFFFDLGRVNTAHTLTSRMTGWIGEMVLKGKEPTPEEPGGTFKDEKIVP